MVKKALYTTLRCPPMPTARDYPTQLHAKMSKQKKHNIHILQAGHKSPSKFGGIRQPLIDGRYCLCPFCVAWYPSPSQLVGAHSRISDWRSLPHIAMAAIGLPVITCRKFDTRGCKSRPEKTSYTCPPPILTPYPI